MIKHLSDRKFTSIASNVEVEAPPAEPVNQDFIRLSSDADALYLTCKKGLLMLVPKI